MLTTYQTSELIVGTLMFIMAYIGYMYYTNQKRLIITMILLLQQYFLVLYYILDIY